MKFVAVRDFRTSPAAIWKRLPIEREMIITNNGKPIALLTPVTDETFEETISAVRQAKAINSLRKIQFEAIKNGTSEMTLDEINAIIKEVREEHKKYDELIGSVVDYIKKRKKH